MRLLAHAALALGPGLEREVVDAIAAQVGALLEPLAPSAAARDRVALFVASPNAGAATALQFWAAALRTGPALASPELFPWCLANAPCGALARHLRITGPNSTWLGEADALRAALESADDLLDDGRVDTALVVALAFAEPVRARASGHALLVGAGGATDARAVLDALQSNGLDWP
jgi:3-oxoacyl-(acyl-carrier-protein) synthase